MNVKVKLSIQTPKVPNFFLTSDGGSVPVGAVDDEGLQEIAMEWLKELRAVAARQQKDGFKPIPKEKDDLPPQPWRTHA